MKVLVATYSYLSGDGGGIYASRANLNAIAEIAGKVVDLAPAAPGRMPEGISPKVTVVPVYDRRGAVRKGIDFYFRGLIHRFSLCFEEYLSEDTYDLVVFDGSCASYGLIDKAHEHGAKVITIHHNWQYEYARDNTRGILSPLYLHWIRVIEREAVLKSEVNLTLTGQDALLLAREYAGGDAGSMKVLGTFEYSRRPLPPAGDRRGEAVFAITGNLSSPQTEDSLIPWIAEYYPILREMCPKARLVVAGLNPGERLRKACRDNGIELIASPADMAPVLEASGYYICPTALGGGIKLRIMDGLRYGLPVLTHEVSARGYDAFAGGCLFTYADAGSFRDSLAGMLRCGMSPAEVQERYRDVFSFDAGVERMRGILDGMDLNG